MDISEYLCSVMPHYKEAWENLKAHLTERYVCDVEYLYGDQAWQIILSNGRRIELPAAPPGSTPQERQHIRSVQIMVPGKQQYSVPGDGITEVADSIPRVRREGL